MNTSVAIIGGTGFLGSYVTKRFLAANYKVKVSTRDKSRQDSYEHLLRIDSDKHPEIIEMDVLDAAAVAQFVKNCEVVVHCGTPFRFDVQDAEAEMYRPTLEGTQNVLAACQGADRLKKLIIVSSVAAINGYVPSFDPEKGLGHKFTIHDTPVTHPDHPPYNQAKYKADQMVHAYIEEHPNLSFEIISLYPGLIIGKPMSEARDSTSAGMLYLLKHKLMPNKMMEMVFEHDIDFAMVAVQDVAEAIFKAATKPGLHGKKYIISNETWAASDVNRMLNGEPPSGNTRMQYSNQEAVEELDLDFTPARVPLQDYGNVPDSEG